jgi:group I intron endonuclease
MIKSIGIYKITNPKGSIYVGQSMNIERRFRGYKKLTNCKGQTKLYNSLVKYGTINHTYEVIELCEVQMLNERERFWQEHFNCIKGLNCNYVSTETKKQIPSDEVRQKMSKAGKGKKQSIEHISSRVNSKKGYKHSEETKRKIAEKHNKLLLDFSTGIFYKNSIEASEALGINMSTLQAMLVGRLNNKTSLIYA